MRRARGEAFDFIPRFFVLPRDYDELQQDIERNPDRLYIQKVWDGTDVRAEGREPQPFSEVLRCNSASQRVCECLQYQMFA